MRLELYVSDRELSEVLEYLFGFFHEYLVLV